MANEYLSRTPSVAGNRKTWTFSCWLKRSKVSNDYQRLFSCDTSSTNLSEIVFNGSEAYDQIVIENLISTQYRPRTTGVVFRDASQYYHILVATDTTQATASDRVKLFVNGNQIALGTGNFPTQNLDTMINSTNTHYIGRGNTYNVPFQGYLADVFFVDGQALAPSVFGQADATSAQWIPKSPATIRSAVGSFGTNGFYLPFKNKTSTTTLGYDYKTTDRSSNNDWSLTNFSTNDAIVDGISNNFATINPLDSTATLADGALTASGTDDAVSTLLVANGKWYAEVLVNATGTNVHVGFTGSENTGMNHSIVDSKRIVYQYAGGVYLDGTGIGSTTGLASYTAGDIIGMAMDTVTGTVKFFKNGTEVYTRTDSSFVNSKWKFLVYGTGSFSHTLNFGQGTFVTSNSSNGYTDSNGKGKFQYTPPSGHLALCEDNITDCAIIPKNHFDTVLYTGTGSAQTITGLNFKPSLVWHISRASSSGYYPTLYDDIRGPANAIFSNVTNGNTASSDGTLSSFNSNGFSVNAGGGYGNSSGGTYVAHCWKGGDSVTTNTSGTRSSQVSLNSAAGFSVVNFSIASGTGEDTVGHGLGAKPDVIMMKSLNNTYNWDVWHKGLGAITNTLILNESAYYYTNRQPFTGSTEPTANVFSIRNAFYGAGTTFTAYCWKEIAGYSSFGKYYGTNTTNFINTGFRPAFVMIRPYTGGTNTTGWRVFDNKRSPSNVNGIQNALYWERGGSTNEVGQNGIDFMSNGFSLISVSDANYNASGTTYIYMAFAELPGDLSNAR